MDGIDRVSQGVQDGFFHVPVYRQVHFVGRPQRIDDTRLAQPGVKAQEFRLQGNRWEYPRPERGQENVPHDAPGIPAQPFEKDALQVFLLDLPLEGREFMTGIDARVYPHQMAEIVQFLNVLSQFRHRAPD